MNIQNLIKLEVKNAFPEDVGRGRARIDRRVCEQYGLTTGDAIELKGAKTTVASVGKSDSLDDGKKIIRIDNLTRNLIGVELGELIKIKKTKVKKAKEVVITLGHGYEGGRVGKGSLPIIKKELINSFLEKGKTIVVSGIGPYHEALPYVVDKTVPKGYVCVDKSTVVKVREEL